MLTAIRRQSFLQQLLTLKCCCCAAGGAAAIGMAQPVTAQPILGDDGRSLTYLFNKALFDGAPGSVNDPSATKLGDNWMEAVIRNNGTGENGAGSVELTLNANLDDASGAFISSVAFNLLGTFDELNVTCNSGAACATPVSNLNYDSINMSNNVRGLDLELLFPTSNSPRTDRLDGTDSVSFTITGVGLTFNSFNEVNDTKQGGLDKIYTAARLQGYDDGSSTLLDGPTEPVPGPLPLLGGVAAFQASRRLRRRLASARLAAAKPPAHRTT
jgi:hypothetical protein